MANILQPQLKTRKPPRQLAGDTYVDMMVIHRCIRPFSKLRTAHWVDATRYNVMKDSSDVARDVNDFSRSMDSLLEMKDEVELAICERLRRLFSVNVTCTCSDITSTFFSPDNCPPGEHGSSRDHRGDCEQIVIGVVPSDEGYPMKHDVLQGDTTDVTTVQQVLRDLKQRDHLEETVFVGDRGMISKLTVGELEAHGFDCLMGVKMRQNEVSQSLLLREDVAWEQAHEHRRLNALARQVEVAALLCWKRKRILRDQQIEVCAERFRACAEQIQALTNMTEPDSRGCRNLLRGCSPNIDATLCQRLIA